MLELYLVSFNCARHYVSPEALAPVFFDALPKATFVPDIVAISLQEVAPIAYSFLGGSYLKPYFDRVATAVHLAADLRGNGSEPLDHVATRSLGMTALMIFAKPRVVERIQWIQSAGTGVGVWNMGNKGAVAMRLGISHPGHDNTLNLIFAAAHLAPMERDFAARNEDWQNIVQNTIFDNDDSAYSMSEQTPLLHSSSTAKETTGLFAPASHLFFAGDLNYRSHDIPPHPDSHKSYPTGSSIDDFTHWLKQDQLNREREANRTLHGLHELPITFPPTYKLSIRRTDTARKRSPSDPDVQWTWAKHRYPSWCDRILFLPQASAALQPNIYTALPVQPTSDHRPVALSVSVDDRPLPRDASGRSIPPFPVNPGWRVRRDNARRWEVVVGVLSYLALTKKGHAVLATVAGVAFASWYVTVWLKR